jgi:hypothetical protein
VLLLIVDCWSSSNQASLVKNCIGIKNKKYMCLNMFRAYSCMNNSCAVCRVEPFRTFVLVNRVSEVRVRKRESESE